jgi:hypothetical protein
MKELKSGQYYQNIPYFTSHDYSKLMLFRNSIVLKLSVLATDTPAWFRQHASLHPPYLTIPVSRHHSYRCLRLP